MRREIRTQCTNKTNCTYDTQGRRVKGRQTQFRIRAIIHWKAYNSMLLKPRTKVNKRIDVLGEKNVDVLFNGLK